MIDVNNPRNRVEQYVVETVRKLANEAGLPMPEVAIYEGEPNAFATGPSRSNSLVAVSTGLLSSMNAQEVEAVLAHEMSHVKNGDMVTMTLLQGVTGSGKTLVYIRLAQELLREGKSVMILVPEIVLTPQMMARFTAYFGAEVALLHSGLRLTERYDQYKRIRRGEAHIVLGTRSAVFAPLRELGLIVLDEEQESSYESGSAPFYHARDIAKYRCAQEGAT